MINGKCKIYQTDRGTEFCNAITDSYCINEKIEHITSNVRHPQTNGSIEVVHKKLQTKIALEKANHKEINNHNIITQCLEAHNNKIHSATLYTPMDLKNITDQNVISEVIENINKSMERKIQKGEISTKKSGFFRILSITTGLITEKK